MTTTSVPSEFRATEATMANVTTADDVTVNYGSDEQNWEESVNFTQTLITISAATAAFIGFLGNIITFITLRRSNANFTPVTLRLLKNQAVADALVCLLGGIFVLQPPMWTTGLNNTLDVFICQVLWNYFFLFVAFRHDTGCRTIRVYLLVVHELVVNAQLVFFPKLSMKQNSSKMPNHTNIGGANKATIELKWEAQNRNQWKNQPISQQYYMRPVSNTFPVLSIRSRFIRDKNWCPNLSSCGFLLHAAQALDVW